MNKTQAIRQIKTIPGLTASATGHGAEIRVRVKGHPERDFFTDDPQDALDTARSMASQAEAPDIRHTHLHPHDADEARRHEAEDHMGLRLDDQNPQDWVEWGFRRLARMVPSIPDCYASLDDALDEWWIGTPPNDRGTLVAMVGGMLADIPRMATLRAEFLRVWGRDIAADLVEGLAEVLAQDR